MFDPMYSDIMLLLCYFISPRNYIQGHIRSGSQQHVVVSPKERGGFTAGFANTV